MVPLRLILVVAAAVCFILAAASVQTGRVSTTALGLLCWLLADAVAL